MNTKLYRFLEAGEIIEPGDEYFNVSSVLSSSNLLPSSWVSSDTVGERVSFNAGQLQLYRRPVPPPNDTKDLERQLSDAKQQITRQAEEIQSLCTKLDQATDVLEVSRLEVEKLQYELAAIKSKQKQPYQEPLYRFLKEGETLQEGDEYYNSSKRKWRPTINVGGIVSEQLGKQDRYRRKASPFVFTPKPLVTVQESPPESNTRLHNLFSTDTNSPFHTQQDGSHYKSLPIQPVQYSQANRLDSCQHSIVKYVTRYKDKGGIKDLKKAIHFIQMLAWSEYGEKI